MGRLLRGWNVWKSLVTNELSVGEIVRDAFGEEQRTELLSLHLDSMLDLFGPDVYQRLTALKPDDTPIPLTLMIDVDDEAPPRAKRLSVFAPSATQRGSAESARQDRA